MQHRGHIELLETAASLGDVLIVGVVDDESVFRYKGKRPVMPLDDRIRLVGALRVVDKVVEHRLADREPTEDEQVHAWRQPCKAAEALVPWCPLMAEYVKDFAITIFVHGDDSAPQEYKGYGVPLVQIPYWQGVSTSGLLREINERART